MYIPRLFCHFGAFSQSSFVPRREDQNLLYWKVNSRKYGVRGGSHHDQMFQWLYDETIGSLMAPKEETVEERIQVSSWTEQ